MAYDTRLADRVRSVLRRKRGIGERAMFGGLAFLLGGKMCCGILKRDLVVRVGPDDYEECLDKPHVRPMDFTGRPLKGYVYVAPPALKSRAALAAWVGRGLEFVRSVR